MSEVSGANNAHNLFEKVRVFKADDVNKLLGYKECIDAMKDVFKLSAEGETVNPLRNIMWLPNNSGLVTMPGYIKEGNLLGLKAVGIFPSNTNLNIDTHQGVVILLDSNTGLLKAIFDASSITAIRTAAASGIATDVLARKDATRLGIIGTGCQAHSHLRAITAVRNITEILVWSRSFSSASSFASSYSSSFPIRAVERIEEVVENSEIICTVTASKEPLFKGELIKEGTHINAVGSCTPTAREIDTTGVLRSRLFTDSILSLSNEAGEYIIPLKEGAITEQHIAGEVGQVIAGMKDGRTSPDQITLFKSLGIAIEDVAAARVLYLRSLSLPSFPSFDFYDPPAPTDP